MHTIHIYHVSAWWLAILLWPVLIGLFIGSADYEGGTRRYFHGDLKPRRRK